MTVTTAIDTSDEFWELLRFNGYDVEAEKDTHPTITTD